MQILKWMPAAAAAALLTMPLLSVPSMAGSECSFDISDVHFGSVNPANGAWSTGTFTANCTGDPGDTFRICPSIGSGSAGSAGGSPRYLSDGSNALQFNLFSDASQTSIWGSYNWGFIYTPPTIDIPIDGAGNGYASATLYARIPAGQSAVPSGTYLSLFSEKNAFVSFRDKTDKSCAEIGNSGDGGNVSFIVQATVAAECTLSATTLDFGSVGVLSSNVDSASTLSIACVSGTPYTIGLNGGSSAASDPTMRMMVQGAEQVTYGLYRDAARTLPWGDTVLGADTLGSNTISETGTGTTQNLTVYGRVPPQATPTPGTYSDTIVVTLTY